MGATALSLPPSGPPEESARDMAHGAVTGALPIPYCSTAHRSASPFLGSNPGLVFRLWTAANGQRSARKWPASFTTRASVSTTKEAVLRDFRDKRTLKVSSVIFSCFNLNTCCISFHDPTSRCFLCDSFFSFSSNSFLIYLVFV